MELCSPVHPLSLREIMDEELARTLQDGEQVPLPVATEQQEQEHADFLLAQRLSQQQAHEGDVEVEVSRAAAEPTSEESDLLFALQLQEELDREAHAQYTNHRAGHGKVAVAFAREEACDAPYEEEARRYGADDYEEAEAEEVGEDDEEEEDEDTVEVPFEMMGIQLDPCVRKAYGRLSAEQFTAQKGVVVTKHDALLNGVCNARNLEQLSVTATGDLMKEDAPLRLNNKVFNSMRQHSAQESGRMRRLHGKSDRATQEGVMDQRTRMLLYKLLNKEVYDEMHGVISTGKEANVYHATRCDSSDLAVKVYRTTLNEFQDRSEYLVHGKDQRRRRRRTNTPFKVVRAWAENEMGHLVRMERAGIRCPHPVFVKDNVLVMEFVGKQGIAAPRLKDANVSDERLHKLYVQVIRAMRKMFVACNLIHADLSEYNILVHKGEAWIIDLAQGVDRDSPNAMIFLRRDCDVITSYFFRAGVTTVLSVRQLFEYITDNTITEDNEDEYLVKLDAQIQERGAVELEDLRDEVFLNSYIPSSLSEVPDPILEYDAVKQFGCEESQVYHFGLTGLSRDLSGQRDDPSLLDGSSENGTFTSEMTNDTATATTDNDDAGDEVSTELELVCSEAELQALEAVLGVTCVDEDGNEDEVEDEELSGGGEEEEEEDDDEEDRPRRPRGPVQSREEMRVARKAAKKERKLAQREMKRQKRSRRAAKKDGIWLE